MAIETCSFILGGSDSQKDLYLILKIDIET